MALYCECSQPSTNNLCRPSGSVLHRLHTKSQGCAQVQKVFSPTLGKGSCSSRPPFSCPACSYHTDPSGTFVQYEAKAIGSGSEGAQTALQEGYRKDMTLKEAEVRQRGAGVHHDLF